MVKSTED